MSSNFLAAPNNQATRRQEFWTRVAWFFGAARKLLEFFFFKQLRAGIPDIELLGFCRSKAEAAGKKLQRGPAQRISLGQKKRPAKLICY